MWLCTGLSRHYVPLKANVGLKHAIELIFPNNVNNDVLIFYAAVGSHWYNIAEPISSVDDLSVCLACLMLILNIILYTALTVYFESIIPSEYGVRKPWYYIFKVCEIIT